jgi:hypothetical protein
VRYVLRFCGFGFELFVDEVLNRRADDPAVCSATDATGQHWLIVEATHDADDISWVCAPASARMVDLVRDGKAEAADAVMHSETGWVEMVRVVGGHAVPDQRLTCSELAAGQPAAPLQTV